MTRETVAVEVPYEFSFTGERKGGRGAKGLQLRRRSRQPVRVVDGRDAVAVDGPGLFEGAKLFDGRCWFVVKSGYAPVTEDAFAAYVDKLVADPKAGNEHVLPFDLGIHLFHSGTFLADGDYLARLVTEEKVKSVQASDEAEGLSRAALDADCLAFVDGVLHSSKLEPAYVYETGTRFCPPALRPQCFRVMSLGDMRRKTSATSFAPAQAADAARLFGVADAYFRKSDPALAEGVAARVDHFERLLVSTFAQATVLVEGDWQTRPLVLGGADEAPEVADALDRCRSDRRVLMRSPAGEVERLETSAAGLSALADAVEALPTHMVSTPDMLEERIAVLRRPVMVWEAFERDRRLVGTVVPADDVEALAALSGGMGR